MAARTPLRRWQTDGIAIAVGAAALSWAFAPAVAQADVDDAFCGMGPPPNAADYKRYQERQATQRVRDGYVSVCEENLRRYATPSPLTALPQAAAGLAFCPVALGGTEFAQFASLGGLVEAIGDVKSAFYRVFRTADGLSVTLFEHDMSADGSQMARAPEHEPERINGLPARLVVWQAASGKAVSVLSWLEGRRAIELWIDANMARGQARARLFAMAEALPKSVPAKAHEPDLVPFAGLGPDGMQPIPSMPATMTEAQMQALLARAATPARAQPIDCGGSRVAPAPMPAP